jgi:hypothetical protein
MHKVPGYLVDLDAALICMLLAWQERCGITGNLCEIGVHHGRLFLLLALSRQSHENALAIDLFEDDNLNTGAQAGRAGALLYHARRLNIKLSPAEVLKGSSLELSASEILQHAGGLIRFFSVDGGHMYHHVENDLRLAYECLSDDGIIAVDDFFNQGWPEVSFAAYDFLRATSDAVPVLVTPSKLYLAKRAFAPRILEFLLSAKHPGMISDFPKAFLGDSVAHFRSSKLARARQLGRLLFERR